MAKQSHVQCEGKNQSVFEPSRMTWTAVVVVHGQICNIIEICPWRQIYKDTSFVYTCFVHLSVVFMNIEQSFYHVYIIKIY